MPLHLPKHAAPVVPSEGELSLVGGAREVGDVPFAVHLALLPFAVVLADRLAELVVDWLRGSEDSAAMSLAPSHSPS